MEELAPIIIFAFNRVDSLKATVKALLQNPEAAESHLYLFVDGPRVDKTGEKEAVALVHQICNEITGFKSVTLNFSKTNRGLGPSIISGVSSVLKHYDSAIILEDDLIVQPNFLAFMNRALSFYEDAKDVWSVCGYSNKITIPNDYQYDAYFCTRSSSWGWGTWKDRWESVDWTFEKWDEWSKMKQRFNRWGGSDCFGMLDGCRSGVNKSWAIRFCFNQFLQNKLSLFPTKSLVKNDGFDGSGTNCKKYSRFKYELLKKDKISFSFPKEIVLHKFFWKQAMRYNSITQRLWSRIMYIIK